SKAGGKCSGRMRSKGGKPNGVLQVSKNGLSVIPAPRADLFDHTDCRSFQLLGRIHSIIGYDPVIAIDGNGNWTMANVVTFQPGGYRFIEHAFQYSGGVAAEPGFTIERVRLAPMLPLADRVDAIEAHLKRLGRPPSAFCACELRSPAQFTDAGFVAFNRLYVQRLESWGIFRDEVTPVARSNVCPEIGPPATPSLFAFCYTV